MLIVKRLYCYMCNLSIPLFAQVPGLWTIRRLPQAKFHDTDGVASVDARIYSYAWHLVSVDGRARTARRTPCKIHHSFYILVQHFYSSIYQVLYPFRSEWKHVETPSNSACGAIILKASNPIYVFIHESFVHEKVAVATYLSSCSGAG